MVQYCIITLQSKSLISLRKIVFVKFVSKVNYFRRLQIFLEFSGFVGRLRFLQCPNRHFKIISAFSQNDFTNLQMPIFRLKSMTYNVGCTTSITYKVYKLPIWPNLSNEINDLICKVLLPLVYDAINFGSVVIFLQNLFI